jgi:hypothetical protein
MLELIIFAFVFIVIGFYIGKWTAIVNIAANAVLEENKKIEKESERYLTIQKVKSVYYAYLDEQFLGQSESKNELMQLIGKHARSFKIMTDFYTTAEHDSKFEKDREEIINLLVATFNN